MKKRLLSGLLLLAMLLSLLPVAASAEDGAEQAPACICKTACTQEARNSDCPVCGADGAQLHDCALQVRRLRQGSERVRRQEQRS